MLIKFFSAPACCRLVVAVLSRLHVSKLACLTRPDLVLSRKKQDLIPRMTHDSGMFISWKQTNLTGERRRRHWLLTKRCRVQKERERNRQVGWRVPGQSDPRKIDFVGFDRSADACSTRRRKHLDLGHSTGGGHLFECSLAQVKVVSRLVTLMRRHSLKAAVVSVCLFALGRAPARRPNCDRYTGTSFRPARSPTPNLFESCQWN